MTCSNVSVPSNEDDDDNEYVDRGITNYSYYRYGSITMIHAKYSSRSSLSIVLLANNKFSCCLTATKIVYINYIDVKVKVHGLWYYNWFNESNIKTCCLFLPRLLEDNDMAVQQDGVAVYAIVDSKRRVLQPNMEFLPLQILH
jgi:hypothetical protein